MAQVPQQTLQWLYNVLSNDYQYPQPTYSLVASALSRYPSLVPRTDVYTYENGHSDLLLALNGNLPVTFRGNIYRFPIELWIPKGSPAEAPFVFVRAEGKADIAIRPGQHVGVDGRIYHPYLRDWGRNEPSNIVDLLRILQDIFAKEPPVVAKQQQQQYQPQSQSPRPPPPPKERSGVTHVEVPSGPVPPPKPPKPGEDYADRVPVNHQRSTSRTGPPLPPLPHELEQRYQSPQQGHGNGYPPPLGPSSASYNQPSSSTARPGPPPLPPLPPQVQQYQQGSSTPVSPLSPNGHARFPDSRYQQAPPLPQSPLRSSVHVPPPQNQLQQAYHQQQQQPYPPQARQPYPAQQYPPQRSQPQAYPPQPQQAPHPAPPAPPPDLLTDPFDITLPPATTPTAPPPIPPNPQKEHLLHLLSTSLVSLASAQLHQNHAALTPLQAQHSALQAAHARLTAELHDLEHLSTLLATNEAILHRSLHDCDAAVLAAKQTPAPDIDDVLVAPTVAQQQLWALCAEIAGIEEAGWALGQAVGRGRVGGEVFVRQTRGLAREGFLRMVLARKVARGLGLVVGRGGRGGGGQGGEGYYG